MNCGMVLSLAVGLLLAVIGKAMCESFNKDQTRLAIGAFGVVFVLIGGGLIGFTLGWYLTQYCTP